MEFLRYSSIDEQLLDGVLLSGTSTSNSSISIGCAFVSMWISFWLPNLFAMLGVEVDEIGPPKQIFSWSQGVSLNIIVWVFKLSYYRRPSV